jgi:mannose-6-phosphate isomerase-like protein (cupin superfamily)
MPAVVVSALLVGYVAGTATSVRDSAAARQATPPAWAAIPLAPNQGEPVYWSSDDLKKAHTELSARSGGRILSKPRDLVQLPMMRTHYFDVVHRPQLSQPPTAEQHEGVTDLYVILGGTGTLTVGGEIENRQPLANRPGEYTGRPIRGGRSYKVKAGDIVDVPPNTPHASQGDAGGLTYMLVKINVGLYPWSLVSGTQ